MKLLGKIEFHGWRQFNQDETQIGQFLFIFRPIKLWKLFYYRFEGETKNTWFSIQTPIFSIILSKTHKKWFS